ncbi:metalloregulator ArsR/SmtB family transcription factor [Occultella aeris]|uniref:Arsenical resistance operon repressor n=1 Tax=Occultella aeris TaxID=2761496 RepID=A0A7M4DKI8_9MICO|nr:metalloregulator ArsR/SmtB family transcription factor [Occultella aeris]VZO37676.1 Arsenical resistance operon repressor [Occultella aeris]
MSTTVGLASVGADCCAPPAGDAALDPATARDIAQGFKALADPTRVQLLAIIAAQPDGEACVCDLTEPVGLSQPTVSHHLKILVSAGLLAREQRGRWAYYSLRTDPLTELATGLIRSRTAASA